MVVTNSNQKATPTLDNHPHINTLVKTYYCPFLEILTANVVQQQLELPSDRNWGNRINSDGLSTDTHLILDLRFEIRDLLTLD
jgi:hypothetical protein